MIVPDVNLLLYAYDTSSKQHEKSRSWLMGCLEGGEQIGIATPTIVAFYRLTTDSRVFRSPLSIEDATAAVDNLLAHNTAAVIHSGERHLAIFKRIVLASRATRDLLPDAHLAAIAIEHGGVVHTNDHDFDRFAELRVEYPLA